MGVVTWAACRSVNAAGDEVAGDQQPVIGSQLVADIG